MNSYLTDFEERSLSSEEEAHEFMAEREKTDKWFQPFVNELSTIGIPMDSPLLTASLMNDLPNFVGTEDALKETMQEDSGSMGLLLHCPNPNSLGAATFPIRYTAIQSLFDRAGIGGRTIRNMKESLYIKILSSTEKADILNRMLSLYSAPCKVLLRDGKISTVRSNQYEVLKSSDLVSELELTMSSEWQAYEYVAGNVSHEYLRLMYLVDDTVVENKLASMLSTTSLKWHELKLGFKFTTSDVGNCTAKVQPVLFHRANAAENWECIQFGIEQGMKHSTGSSMKRWQTQVLPRIGLLVQEMQERIHLFSKQKITYPGDCLRKVCFELKLPKKTALEVSEEFENSYQYPSAMDVYCYLFEIIEREEATRNLSPSQKLRYSEAASSAILLDFKERDYPFTWE